MFSQIFDPKPEGRLGIDLRVKRDFFGDTAELAILQAFRRHSALSKVEFP